MTLDGTRAPTGGQAATVETTAATTPLEVAVAAMGVHDPDPVVAQLGLAACDASVLIINQVLAGPVPDPVDRGRVRMLSFREQGVSRSRNRAIEHSRGEVLLFADDDLQCFAHVFPEVTAAFATHADAAAITFRCEGLQGSPSPTQRRQPGRHTPLSVASVRSVEIAVAPQRLGAVRFDAAFGLGTDLPSGEEAVFLRDLQRAGQVVRHCPLAICRHERLSSGQRPWDTAMARTKGAVLRRMYPLAWPLPLAYLAATKYETHGKHLGALTYSAAMLGGALKEGR